MLYMEIRRLSIWNFLAILAQNIMSVEIAIEGLFA